MFFTVVAAILFVAFLPQILGLSIMIVAGLFGIIMNTLGEIFLMPKKQAPQTCASDDSEISG